MSNRAHRRRRHPSGGAPTWEEVDPENALCTLCKRPLKDTLPGLPTASLDIGGGHMLYACSLHAQGLYESVGLPWPPQSHGTQS